MAAIIAPRTYEDANQEKISAAWRIPQNTFLTSIEVFFSLALLSVIGRMITRSYTRRRLDSDDYLLLFALICLGASTGLVHVFYQTIFVAQAVTVDPTVKFPQDRCRHLSETRQIVNSFLCIIWTTIFAVKLSFLALFRLLVRRLPKPITNYYWATVGITIATWIFFIAEPFILCPYIDTANQLEHCTLQTPYGLTTTLTALITCLDIITDVMIVGIPIIVLRKTQLKSSQKVGLSILMGLSAIMAIIAVVRMSGYSIGGSEHRKIFDVTWQVYWLYMEGCIACIMASVVAFRSLFIVQGARPDKQSEQRPSYSIWPRLLQTPRNSRFKRCRDPTSDEEDQLPVIPTATPSSVRKFVRGTNNPIEPSTELSVTCLRGDENTTDPMDKNHIYVRDELNITSQRVSLER